MAEEFEVLVATENPIADLEVATENSIAELSLNFGYSTEIRVKTEYDRFPVEVRLALVLGQSFPIRVATPVPLFTAPVRVRLPRPNVIGAVRVKIDDAPL